MLLILNSLIFIFIIGETVEKSTKEKTQILFLKQQFVHFFKGIYLKSISRNIYNANEWVHLWDEINYYLF